ncbi:MAG: TlpA family protein disulfide reductase, partial [Flavobacteriaceae bacterium]|nr:TlpA family protein disulfide reductase [Flavobacteriaceae bacterium]
KINSRVILLDDADEKMWIPKIDPNWDGGIPATLIYNKDKRTFYAHAFTKEALLKEVNKFISLD